MIEVKTSELVGAALDWAVGVAEGNPMATPGSDVVWSEYHGAYNPSTNWSQGGPLIDRYGVLLSPPKSMMHINGGPNAGWRETGVWGSTIFGAERKHRRRAFEHTDQPLVAAMRAIVQFELGDTVSVPAELVGGSR